LEYPNETNDEDDDGADVLNDDRGVCHQRPERIRFKPWIALQVFEEGILIRIVIRIYISSAIGTFPSQKGGTHKTASPTIVSSTPPSSAESDYHSAPYSSVSLDSATLNCPRWSYTCPSAAGSQRLSASAAATPDRSHLRARAACGRARGFARWRAASCFWLTAA
jgi:hypothetical protein